MVSLGCLNAKISGIFLILWKRSITSTNYFILFISPLSFFNFFLHNWRGKNDIRFFLLNINCIYYILFVRWTQKLPTKWYLFRKGNDFLLFKLIFNLDSCL